MKATGEFVCRNKQRTINIGLISVATQTVISTVCRTRFYVLFS